MPYRRFRRSGFRRTSRHYTWNREASNDPATIVAPGHYQEDLLLNFRNAYGIGLQFPEITIWRIRLRITVGIKWVAAPVNFETAGAVVGVFVEDIGNINQGVEAFPLSQQYMLYKATYYEEYVLQGARQISASNTDFVTAEYDIKARRKFRNVSDTLVLQVGTLGSPVLQFVGLAWNASILMTLGRR